MSGAIPPLPNTTSWRGAQLRHRDNFYWEWISKSIFTHQITYLLNIIILHLNGDHPGARETHRSRYIHSTTWGVQGACRTVMSYRTVFKQRDFVEILGDLRFSGWWSLKSRSFGLWRRVILRKDTNASKNLVLSISSWTYVKMASLNSGAV
jgi:hypothetical protein